MNLVFLGKYLIPILLFTFLAIIGFIVWFIVSLNNKRKQEVLELEQIFSENTLTNIDISGTSLNKDRRSSTKRDDLPLSNGLSYEYKSKEQPENKRLLENEYRVMLPDLDIKNEPKSKKMNINRLPGIYSDYYPVSIASRHSTLPSVLDKLKFRVSLQKEYLEQTDHQSKINLQKNDKLEDTVNSLYSNSVLRPFMTKRILDAKTRRKADLSYPNFNKDKKISNDHPRLH